jgi:hypothetical protein
VLTVVASVCVVTLFSVVVPYDMDEFIYYNIIACRAYPGNDINGHCDPHALNVLGTGLVLPLRSFLYVGSIPALYYLPLWLLWKSPLSARLVSWLFLMGGAALFARAFRFPFAVTAVLFSLFFPYAFQHLVDTGPVGPQICTVYALYILIDRWCSTLRWRYALGSAVVMFLGIWIKLSYFWFAPGIAIFFVIACIRHRRILLRRGACSRLAIQSIVAILVCAGMAGSYIFSTHPLQGNERPLLTQLLQSQMFSIREILHGALWHTRAFEYLLHPLEATQRIYYVSPLDPLWQYYYVLLFLFVPAFLILSLVLWKKEKEMREYVLMSIALFIAFLLTVAMVARTKNAVCMHHIILTFPFLLLAIGAAVKGLLVVKGRRVRPFVRSVTGLWLLLFLALNVRYFMVFPRQNLIPSRHSSKEVLRKVLLDPTVARNSMVVAADWGFHYFQALYGDPEQSVVLHERLRDPVAIRWWKQLAADNGRRVIFMMTKPDAERIRTFVSTVQLERCTAVPLDAPWQMFSEPDPAVRQRCEEVRRMLADGATFGEWFSNRLFLAF